MAINIARRKVILAFGAAAWPFSARAQQRDRMRRIGVLMSIAEDDPEAKARVAALREGFEKLGWMDGRNIQIDYRWTAGDAARMTQYAAELAALTPDVIVANSAPALASLERETRSIPIVFVQVLDPVASGLVASLSRPGGNVTGFSVFEDTMAGKWLELLKEIAPQVTRVATIFDPTLVGGRGLLRAITAAAGSFAVTPTEDGVRDANEIEGAINSFARDAGGSLIVLPGPVTSAHRNRIVSLAAQHHLPAVYPYRFFATSGGLLSYGPDNIDLYRRVPSYVDRILKGEKPGDLPIQQPTKFELVINLKTAKALDLTVPLRFQQLADEVIE